MSNTCMYTIYKKGFVNIFLIYNDAVVDVFIFGWLSATANLLGHETRSIN